MDGGVDAQLEVVKGIYDRAMGRWEEPSRPTASTRPELWPRFTWDSDSGGRSAGPNPALSFDGESVIVARGRARSDGPGTELVVNSQLLTDLDDRLFNDPLQLRRVVFGAGGSLLFYPQLCSVPGGETALAFFYSDDGITAAPHAMGATRAADRDTWDGLFHPLSRPFVPRGTNRTFAPPVRRVEPDGRVTIVSGIEIDRYTPVLPDDPAWPGVRVYPPAYQILTSNDQFAQTSLGDYLGLTWVPPSAPLARGEAGVFYCAWSDQAVTGYQASQIAVRRFRIR